MSKLRTLIVDDEPLARQGLALLVGTDPDLELVGECADGREALAAIRALRPDLAFLDVHMPVLDGFQVLAALAPAERPCIVFVTAYEQHAIQAFEVAAVDYLLKPPTDARFHAAVERAKRAVRQLPAARVAGQVEQLLEYVRRLDPSPTPDPAAPVAASRTEYADRIVLKADGALHFIRSSDVVWIEAQGDFVKVQTIAGKTQLVRETLQSMEQKLDPAKFLRIHRSFVINLEHVRRVEPALYGDYGVHMSDGTKLRLSRSYRSKLKALLRQPGR